MQKSSKIHSCRNAIFLHFFTILIFACNHINADNNDYYKKKKESYSIFLKNFLPNYPLKDDTSGIIDTLNTIDHGLFFLEYAKYLFLNKKYSEALTYTKKAKELFSKNICEQGIGATYYLRGHCFTKTNQNDSVVSNFLKAIKHSLLCNNIKAVALSYNNLGNHFSKNSNWILSEKYYLNGLTVIENSSYKQIKDVIQFNIANNYLNSLDYNKALFHYKILKKSLSDSTNTLDASKIYNNLGIIYLNDKKYKEAINNFEKAIQIKNNRSDTIGLINSYQNLFYIGIETNNNNYATKNYEILKTLINEETDLKTKVDFLFNCINYHLLTPNINEAKKCIIKFNAYNDSLQNTSFSNKLIEMQKSFQMQEKEREIALLTKEDELNKATLKNQQLVIIFIAIFSILLILAGIQINLHRVKLKISQKETLLINQKLEQSNAAKNQILSIIGHDLRGPIGGLKQLMELYLDNPGLIENDIQSVLLATKESSTNAYHLLENLLTWANSQHGSIKYEPDYYLLYPLVKHILSELDTTLGNKNIHCNIHIDEQLAIYADDDMLTIVIRNLISNAIKFSRKGEHILLNAHCENNHVIFSIKDNGKGMSESELELLFEKKEIYYLSDNKTGKGSGLGILLCKNFIEKHQGSIWAESKINEGTSIFFKLPLRASEILELA